MIFTRKFTWVLIVLALLIGLYNQWTARGAWQERAKDLAGQVDSTNALLKTYQYDSVTYVRKLDSLSQIARKAASQAARGKIVFQATRDTLSRDSLLIANAGDSLDLDSLSGPVRELVMSQHTFIQRAFRALEQARDVVEAQDSQIVALEAQDSINKGIVAGLQVLKSRLLAERDSARALNKPPSPFALTFEIAAGPGCTSNGVQTTCGLSAQLTLVRFRVK
jgi:ABC-type transporter Mla subunit MlaD